MRRSLLGFALAGALLAACGDDRTLSSSASDERTTEAPTSAPGPAPTAAPGGTDGTREPAVPEALEFSAPLVGGEQLDFRGYAGETVALWFWAPT